MELSSKDREILACAYFQADAPISWIAKQTGYREHVVRAALNKMLEVGIIARYAIINPYTSVSPIITSAFHFLPKTPLHGNVRWRLFRMLRR